MGSGQERQLTKQTGLRSAKYAKTGNMRRSRRSLEALRGSQNGSKITFTVAELLCHEAGRRVFVRNGYSACYRVPDL
jgi:hypothetical protein